MGTSLVARWRRLAPLAGGALLCVAYGSVAVFGAPGAQASASNPAAAAYFSDQWGLAQVGLTKANAPGVWQIGTGGGVKIGIVDTGVDPTHPDLAGKIAATATCMNTNGDPSQCTTGSGTGVDDNGHGTHVSGIAAGAGNGIAGVAPGASLVVAKVLNSQGSGNTSDVSAGIEWVVEHGARVVNLSLGSDPGFLGVDCLVGGCSSGTITDAVEYAWQHGAIPVIAAGNNAGDLFGPGGYGSLDAIVVAATGPSGQFASDYSSTPGNAKWGVLAPGGDDPNGPSTPTCGQYDPDEILSSYWTSSGGGCYASDEGTSMATPFVSGALADLLGRGLNQQEAVNTLLSTLNKSVTCGSGQGCQGLINVDAAMVSAARQVPNPPSSSKSSGSGSGSSGSHGGSASSGNGGGGGGTGTSPGSGAGVQTRNGTTSTPSTQAPFGLTAGSSGPNGKKATAAGRHGSGGSPWLPLLIVLAVCVVAGAGLAVWRMSRPRAQDAAATGHSSGGPGSF